MPTLLQKVQGALYGTAIGDGMGGPVEGFEPERIAEGFGDWDFARFIPPQDWPPKGDGRITDDTLMVEALIRAYLARRGHLDAYDFREYLVPEYARTIVWVPERQCDMPLLERMNSIEKFSWMRLAHYGADPRVAGVGNAIHCGYAMFVMPIGAINAGDPRGAYQEACAFGLAETTSYAVEGGAVLAAAYAEAMAHDATLTSVLATGYDTARDGTAAAIQAVYQVTDPADDLPDFIAKVRAAFLPFCPKRRPHGVPDMPLRGTRPMNAPSDILAIEEVPVALACLRYGDGDYLKTLRASVRYGRDCDTIAGMASGLYGALYGVASLPDALRTASDAANRRDYADMGRQFTQVILGVHLADSGVAARRVAAMEQ